MSTPDGAGPLEVEEIDTAAAAAIVLDEDDPDVNRDGEAPTEAGGPPAPEGEGQDG